MLPFQREALWLSLGSTEVDAMRMIALSLEQPKQTYFATFHTPKCTQGPHLMFYLLSKFEQTSDTSLSKSREKATVLSNVTENGKL